MWFIAIGCIGIERRRRDLQSENTNAQPNERDVEIILAYRGAEYDEAERHEDGREGAEIQSVFWFAVVFVVGVSIAVSLGHVEHYMVGGAAGEEFA